MKRKILSLILVLMLLPLASLFSACGENKGYDLNNLETDYQKLALYKNVYITDNKISFAYSNNTSLYSNINKDKYKEIQKYNDVFYGIMDFAKNHIDKCTDNSVTTNATIKNNIQYTLNELNEALGVVNGHINLLAEIMNISNNDIYNETCLSRLENLLLSYSNLYEAAIDFTYNLIDLYYNYVLNNSNPDIYKIDFNNFDANVVVNTILSRVSFQRFNLSANFVEMYIRPSVAKDISNGSNTFNLYFNNYKTCIDNLNVSVSNITVAADKANNLVNKNTFYNYAIEAYNCVTTLNNDRAKFIEACKEIKYAEIILEDDRTPQQEICLDIILGNLKLIKTYNNILVEMLKIIAN